MNDVVTLTSREIAILTDIPHKELKHHIAKMKKDKGLGKWIASQELYDKDFEYRLSIYEAYDLLEKYNDFDTTQMGMAFYDKEFSNSDVNLYTITARLAAAQKSNLKLLEQKKQLYQEKYKLEDEKRELDREVGRLGKKCNELEKDEGELLKLHYETLHEYVDIKFEKAHLKENCNNFKKKYEDLEKKYRKLQDEFTKSTNERMYSLEELANDMEVSIDDFIEYQPGFLYVDPSSSPSISTFYCRGVDKKMKYLSHSDSIKMAMLWFKNHDAMQRHKYNQKNKEI